MPAELPIPEEELLWLTDLLASLLARADDKEPDHD